MALLLRRSNDERKGVMKPIEYLSLYLPYKLYLWDEVKQKPVVMNMGEGSSGNWVGIKAVSRYHERGNYVYKPLLLPLSMLTEEMVKWLSEGRFKYFNSPKRRALEWWEMRLDDPLNIPFNVFQEVLRRHGDPFGLIQEGKAIDKSKL